MPPLTPAVRSHLWRLLRLTAVTVATAPAVAALVHTAVLRWPLLGVVIGACEIIARAIAPTVPAPPPVTPGSRVPPSM